MYVILPEGGSGIEREVVMATRTPSMNDSHWANFLDCVKTRQRPTSDIEICQRSSTACILANVSLRSGVRVDWDEKAWTAKQPEAKRLLAIPPRKEWTIRV
jgi:hypothetical protein